MMNDVMAIWLGFEGCSKRAVQYAPLSPQIADFTAVEAASSGKGMSLVEYQTAAQRAGAARMIVAYSADPIEKEPDLTDPEVVKAIHWTKTSPTEMSVQYAAGEIFTAKDTAILNQIFQRLHDASGFEVAQIMGKATRVAT